MVLVNLPQKCLRIKIQIRHVKKNDSCNTPTLLRVIMCVYGGTVLVVHTCVHTYTSERTRCVPVHVVPVHTGM